MICPSSNWIALVRAQGAEASAQGLGLMVRIPVSCNVHIHDCAAELQAMLGSASGHAQACMSVVITV
jgi:hypothetical protein